jgi:hypothetical protein
MRSLPRGVRATIRTRRSSVLSTRLTKLIGAKQNRVLNLTILAPPKRVTVIPVSCVEAGRWHMQSAAFNPAPHVMYARGRAARTSQVTASMRSTGTRRSDQSAVWSDITAKASRMNAASPTQAMAAVYDHHALTIEEYVRAFAPRSRQVWFSPSMDARPGWTCSIIRIPCGGSFQS